MSLARIVPFVLPTSFAAGTAYTAKYGTHPLKDAYEKLADRASDYSSMIVYVKPSQTLVNDRSSASNPAVV